MGYSQKNEDAFVAVMTTYDELRHQSDLRILDYGKVGGGTINRARPTPSDFFCDVQKCLAKVTHFKDQVDYRQKVGRLFLRFRIWPVRKYFSVIRQKVSQ